MPKDTIFISKPPDGFNFNNEKILKVDGKMICKWDDTIEVDNENNQIIVNVGKH